MTGRMRFSLLAKILLSTSFAITLLFAVTGWIVQNHTVQTIEEMLYAEVDASFQAYESLWRSRAATLEATTRVLSSMSDVRAAFSTGDRATIRDLAADAWMRLFDSDTVFLVTDPQGRVIASLGGDASMGIEGDLGFVRAARGRFPQQSSGFVFINDLLYQVTVTPVLVQSGPEQLLLNVVVAGYRVDSKLAADLKNSTGGSEYVFVSAGRVLASTLPPDQSRQLAALTEAGRNPPDYAPHRSELRDLVGNKIAELWILRPFATAGHRLQRLRRNIVLLYLLTLSSGLIITSYLARRLVRPIRELDRAAAEVARENYDSRVDVKSQDELGRLAATFNSMCESIQGARRNLIRQERIATIGQLSTSIVHDLRNPLAAIYGGAEMLVDGDLPPAQVKRLGSNIYRASRNIQELLQELVDVSHGKADRTEVCSLREVIAAAAETVRPTAEACGVSMEIDVPPELEASLARARMERVFANLLMNSVEAMGKGGKTRVSARLRQGEIFVDIEDNGPGIPADLRGRLFEPFVSEGKKNGLGLGLALSRQTVLSHGGDLWLANGSPGAHFCMRLNLEPAGTETKTKA